MLAGLSEWNFDIFGFHAHGRTADTQLYLRLPVRRAWYIRAVQSVRRETFASFITAIEDGYHTDVQRCRTTTTSTRPTWRSTRTSCCRRPHCIRPSLRSTALLRWWLLRCTTTAHPGTNNAYQIAVGSEWAVRYNDICVLENMHCSEAFFILRKPDCNIFENLSHGRATRDTLHYHTPGAGH